MKKVVRELRLVQEAEVEPALGHAEAEEEPAEEEHLPAKQVKVEAEVGGNALVGSCRAEPVEGEAGEVGLGDQPADQHRAKYGATWSRCSSRKAKGTTSMKPMYIGRMPMLADDDSSSRLETSKVTGASR